MKTQSLPGYLDGPLLWLCSGAVAVVLLSFTVWILVLLRSNKYKEQRRQQIRQQWSSLLADLLLDEVIIDEGFVLPANFKAELRKPFVRGVLAAELVRTRNSLRGQMTETVVALYNRMELVQHSAQLLASRKWHRTIKGIQQLSSMSQYQFSDDILRLIDHPNIWVRNEAQLGMIRLHGLSGLHFLGSLKYPLSEWQQFNMLHELHLLPAQEPEYMAQWLAAPNSSVVRFGIRLCQLFQSYQFAGLIGELQQHTDASVRVEANQCLHQWGLEELHTNHLLHAALKPLQAELLAI